MSFQNFGSYRLLDPYQFREWLLLAARSFGIALLINQATFADDERSAARIPLLPKYQQECSACHIAYPPDMLPAASWQRVLNNLPQHYGTDASLDAASVKELARWLSANAGNDRSVRAEPAEDRITKSAWFIRQHDEIAAAVWQRPAVKSSANCSACHARADQGDFNEHSVRIPR